MLTHPYSLLFAQKEIQAMSDCHCNCQKECCCDEHDFTQEEEGCNCCKKAFLIRLAILSVATASAILLVKAIRR